MGDMLQFNANVPGEVRVATPQQSASSGNDSAAKEDIVHRQNLGLAAKQRCDHGQPKRSRPRIQCTECGADRELLKEIAWEFDQERYPCCDPVPIEERHEQNSRIEQRWGWEEFSL
jgi:hypothetical protein